VLDGVLDGRIDRGAGSCAAQLLNVLLRAVELERKVRLTDELEGRVEELERALTDTGGGRVLWGG
jgi:hypothetical protein